MMNCKSREYIKPRKIATRLPLYCLAAAHAILLSVAAAAHSPMMDEIAHLASGLSCWELGTFDLYKVNPPLIRMAAAPAVIARGARTGYSSYSRAAGMRAEFRVMDDFTRANGPRVIPLVTTARLALIPLVLWGGYICYRWAKQIYGGAAGIAALSLWCFSPIVLGYSHALVNDAGSAALGVAAAYNFWRWLRQPGFGNALVAGVALGLAELTKTTWVVLFALWPALWVIWHLDSHDSFEGPHRRLWRASRRARRPLKMRPYDVACLSLVLALGIFFINVGYGFEGSCSQLRHYRFLNRLLNDDARPAIGLGNRFAESWVGRMPVPLPRAYVEGIDLQWHDIEVGKPSYLRGRWKDRGWWYWYLYALAVKVPLGTWGLFGLAVAVRVGGWWGKRRGRAQRAASRHPRAFPEGEGDVAGHPSPLPTGEGGKEAVRCGANWRDEIVLLAPAVAVLALVSSQTGFSRYIRYVLPMFPFVFIWIASVVTVRRPRWIAFLAWAFLAWSVGSSLWYAPHWMSYFNELAGGPLGGPRHLIDAQVDWGQDLLYLKKWLDAHPEARPLPFVYFGDISPKIAAVDFVLPPKGNVVTDDRMEVAAIPDHLTPGWYAVSVNYLYGYPHRVYHEDGSAEWLNRPYYSYFRRFQPVAYAGYSIYIYHLTAHDIEAAR